MRKNIAIKSTTNDILKMMTKILFSNPFVFTFKTIAIFSALLVFFLNIAILAYANGNAESGIPKICITSSYPETQIPYTRTIDNSKLVLDTPVTAEMQAFVVPVATGDIAIWQEKLLESDETVECRCPPGKKVWHFDLSDKNFSVDDFPRLLLSWNQSDSEATPPTVVAKAGFEVPTSSKMTKPQTYTAMGGGDIEKLIYEGPHVTLDMKTATYAPKSKLYLAKRELGLKADNGWRYTIDGQFVSLQTRVDLPLAHNQLIQLITTPNGMPSRIHFSVDTTGNGRRDQFILKNIDQYQSVETIQNGQKILTIDLKNTLAEMGIDPEKAMLMEPIFYFHMSRRKYMQEKPLQKIVFGSQKKSEDGIVIFPQKTQAGNRTFLEYDFLQALENKGVRNSKWRELTIEMQFSSPQSLTVEGIRLFDAFPCPVPLIANEPSKAMHAWTGEKLPLGQYEQITSFRPLNWSWLDQPKGFLAEYTQDNFSDKDCKIIADGSFYHLDKALNTFHLNGIFLDHDSHVTVKIRPKHYARTLKFDGKGPKTLALLSISEKGKFYLPANRGLVFDIKPEDDESTDPNRILKWELSLTSFDKFPLHPPFSKKHCSTVPVQLPNQKFTFDPVQFSKNMDVTITERTVAFDSLQAKLSLNEVEWWKKVAIVLPEFPIGQVPANLFIDTAQKRIFLFSQKNKINQYWIPFPEKNFFAPLRVNVPGKIPEGCQLFLQMDNRKVPLQEGNNDLDGLVERPMKPGSGQSSASLSHTLAIEILYDGREPMISIGLPKLSLFGVRWTAEDEYRKLFLQVARQRVYIPFVQFSGNGGKWVDLGKICLDKGEHAIAITNSPFFEIKQLLFETNTPLPIHNLETEAKAPVPVWKKLAAMGLKGLIVLAGLGTCYAMRVRIRKMWSGIWQPFPKWYWILLPKGVWTILWLFISMGLYGLGLWLMPPTWYPENYAFTFGGIFLVVFLWHLGILIKEKFFRHLPNVAPQVYRSRGSMFFAWALVLLIFHCATDFGPIGNSSRAGCHTRLLLPCGRGDR